MKPGIQHPSFADSLRFRWLPLSMLTGIASGSAAAVFLISLQWVTNLRTGHPWLIWLLPLAGYAIGRTYYRYGGQAAKGNDLLFEAFYRPRATIPFRMAPLVLLGTLLTHLTGGSAGREGTAVQMGAAIADRLHRWFRRGSTDRRLLLVCGISGGFAAVFGTPWAGAVFAIEVLGLRKMRYDAILPAVVTAWAAHWVCLAWPVGHAHYTLGELPQPGLITFGWVVLLGVLSGWVAWLFIRTTHGFRQLFNRISSLPLRPVAGGLVLLTVYLLTDSQRYAGLGLPVITAAFSEPLLPWDFLLKLLFTAFTLGAGFKGGEVTPLFFIGATLGNALGGFIPLPLGFLAALGFVAVFAGATNTPLACLVMGMELFGWQSGLWLTVVCTVAYLSSGYGSIYTAQPLGGMRRQMRYRQLRFHRKTTRK